MKKDRGKVWLGVCAIIVNAEQKWLVVKKTYSGLKGVWSLPAGFVQAGETIDMAAVREAKEETGIDIEISGLVGFRSGVIRGEISDNMAMLLARPLIVDQSVVVQAREIEVAEWLSPEELVARDDTSKLLHELAKDFATFKTLQMINGLNPGDIFGYTNYKLFFDEKQKGNDY